MNMPRISHLASATFALVLFAPAQKATAQTAPSVVVGTPFPDAIDLDDCRKNIDVDVPLRIAPLRGEQVFVWAGLGDCSSPAARTPGATASCWEVLPGAAPVEERGGAVVLRLGAQDIVGQLAAFPPYEVAYRPPSAAACTLGPGTAVTGAGPLKLQLTIVVANGPSLQADEVASVAIPVTLL
jgi:hypothetical protein